jgi:signal transduction histidine kinase
VRIEVVDQGQGVKPEEMTKIFEPFYRGTMNEDKKGNGLGLFIARRIVELHGGRIQAAANQPQGTMISIELPQLNA